MSIFTRLLLLLGLLPALSLAVVLAVLWRNSAGLARNLDAENRAAGRRALDEGSRLLEEDLGRTHVKIVLEKARRVEGFFADIAGAVQLEATLAAQFLADAGGTGAAPPLYPAEDLLARARADPEFRRSVVDREPYAIFHVAAGVPRADVDGPMDRLRRLGGFFAHTRHTLPGCDSVYFGDRRGFILGYPGGINPFPPTYDPRLRPWFKDAVARGGRTWSVGVDKDGRTLFVTCAQPVVADAAAAAAEGGDEGEDRLLGVAAVDVRLADVIEELFTVGGLRVSKAVLLDNDDKVRVSARYDEGGRASFDEQTLLRAPPVGELADEPGFARVARQARAAPASPAGIVWEGDGLSDSAHVFVYSSIRFAMTPAGGGSAATAATAPAGTGDQQWRYVVQLPVAPLAGPVRAVTGEMDASTRDVSAAIQSGARKSGLAVVAVTAGTLLAALALAYLGARSTARPLVHLAGVARDIGRGDLNQAAAERSGGEVGELERAMNSMIRGLRERRLLRDTFGRYVSASVVDEVLSRGDVRLGGVKRTVTVFFSDLKGFTSLAEATEPETLVQLLNEYFEAMTAVVLESGGTLDKYIGDAILAFWGEPVAHADDAARACRAALEQFRRLQDLRAGWDARGLPRLDMRVGIQTGEAIVGNVGSALKLNYTVLGDTVNLASRLEGVNKLYGTRVLIGEATRQAAGAAIEVRELDLLSVVGKHEPVRVYELLGLAGEVDPRRRAGYAAYEAALRAQRERRWDDAESLAGNALAALGADGPTQVLLARVAAFRRDPPADAWDGAVVLDRK
jgi:class 3 adenylate cyclase